MKSTIIYTIKRLLLLPFSSEQRIYIPYLLSSLCIAFIFHIKKKTNQSIMQTLQVQKYLKKNEYLRDLFWLTLSYGSLIILTKYLFFIKNNILDLTAAEVMSPKVKTIRPTALASEALQIMNDGEITSLFVLEEDNILGILHIHDCLRAGVA